MSEAGFYKGWTVPDAIDALMAYDVGCVDSGVRDDEMKAALRTHLQEMGDIRRGEMLTDFLRSVVCRPTDGYTIEDVAELLKWLADELGVYI